MSLYEHTNLDGSPLPDNTVIVSYCEVIECLREVDRIYEGWLNGVNMTPRDIIEHGRRVKEILKAIQEVPTQYIITE